MTKKLLHRLFTSKQRAKKSEGAISSSFDIEQASRHEPSIEFVLVVKRRIKHARLITLDCVYRVVERAGEVVVFRNAKTY